MTGRTVPIGLVLAALLSLPACTGTGTPSQHPAAVSQATAPAEAREAASPDPNFDYGFTVLITSQGFHPHWLVAACCRPITWRNLTPAPVSVVFDHVPGGSGAISPGGGFTFTPGNVESISYHSGSDTSRRGVIQVNQSTE